MTTYPASIDNSSTLPTAIDNNTPVQASVVNQLRDAILAIEAELGVKPSSTYGTVKARLDALEGIVGNLLIIELAQDLGGTLEDPLVIGIQGRPVSDVAPTLNQVISWNGIAWAPRTISSSTGSQTLAEVLALGNDADGYLITNLLDPVSAQDAATKNYVDTHGGGGSQTLAQTLDLGNTTDGYNIVISTGDVITITDDPINSTDGANKAYVDGYTEPLFNTIYVDANTICPISDGFIGAPFATFTEGLAALGGSGNLQIAPGNYTGEIVPVFPESDVTINNISRGTNKLGISQIILPALTGDPGGTVLIVDAQLSAAVSSFYQISLWNCQVNGNITSGGTIDVTNSSISTVTLTSDDIQVFNCNVIDVDMSCSGVSIRLVNCVLSGVTPSIVFTGSPGQLKLDDYTKYFWDALGGSVTNGTVVLESSASAGSQSLAQTLALGNDADGYKITNLADPTSAQDAATKAYVDGYIFYGGDGYGSGDPASGNVVVVALASGHTAARYEITAYAEIITAPTTGTVDASITYTSASLGSKIIEMFPNPQSLTPTGPLNWFSTTIYSNGTADITVTFTMASVTGNGGVGYYVSARKF